MFANISWLLALMVLLCGVISSTDAWLFARVTASTFSTITDRVSTTTTSASTPSVFSSALTVSDFDYENAEAAPWCSWLQGQEWNGFEMHCGVDYYQGGDIIGQWANNVDDCVATCNSDPDCNFLSYQAENDDGSYGMCWLKNGSGVVRHDKTILGMFRIAAGVPPVSPSVSSATSSTSLTIVASSATSSLSTSTSSKSVSFTTSPTAISTSSSQAFPISTTVPASSSTRSSSVTVVVESTHTAAQGESGGHSSIVPPFWFSEAHPCYPKGCSNPVTTYGRTSHPLTAITFSSHKATVTRSVVTTNVVSSSKISITKPVSKTTLSVGYSAVSTSSAFSKASTRSSAYSLSWVSSEYVRPSSSHTYSKPSRPSKSYAMSSPASSYPTTGVITQHSSYSCAIVTGVTTCSGNEYAVSTETKFTTTTLDPGTKTITVYKTVPTQSSTTFAVTSGSKTYTVYGSTTSKTAVSGKPTVSTSTGKSTVTSNTTVTSKTTATGYTSVSGGYVSTESVLTPGPTLSSSTATSTVTKSLTSKTTVTSKATGSSRSTTSGSSSVTSTSSGVSNSTASGVSSGSTVVSKSSTTISDEWKDPSTWYAPTGIEHTTKPTSTGAVKPSYTAGHYSHLETSSVVTSEAVSSSKTSPILASPSSTTSKDVVTATSQVSVYTFSFPASMPYTIVSTARVSEVSSTSLQGGARPSSSPFTSPQPTSTVTPTTSGAVTKSVSVSWSWTSTPKPSSDRSAGQRLVFSPSLGMAVVFASSFILPFVAW